MITRDVVARLAEASAGAGVSSPVVVMVTGPPATGKTALTALEGLFEQVLRPALEAGTMKLGRVSLDSTEMKANASKHKATSWKRMQETEQRLQREVL